MKILAASAACLAFVVSSALGQQNDLAEKAKQGKELMAAGRFEEAIPIYRELAKALPENPGPLMDLGLALHMAGHEREAVTQFRMVLKRKPSDVPAHLFLGAAYLGLKDPAKAVEPLRSVVRRQPENRDGRQLLGDALLSLGRFGPAAEQFEKLTQLDGGNPKTWNGLGLSYEGLAQDNFEKLEKLAPNSAYWLVLLAESHAKGDEYKGAFYFYREALKKMPGLRGVRTGLAEIYRKTDHPTWAEIEEQKEASLPPLVCGTANAPMSKPASRSTSPAPEDPQDRTLNLECDFWARRFSELISASRGENTVEAYYWRTRAYNELAKRAFSRLTKLPPSGEVHELLAKIQFSHRKYTEAAKEWKEALKFSPDSSFYRQGYAISLSAVGDYENARPLLEDLIKESPNSEDLNYWLGYSLLGLERSAEAIPFLERAVQIDPTALEPHRDLARAYLRVGQIEKALPHARAASPIDVDGSLYYQLAQAYRMTGQTKSEKEMLEKFRESQSSATAEKKRLEEQIQITPP
jgi:tetratricopeptide (TPR) repeat protein